MSMGKLLIFVALAAGVALLSACVQLRQASPPLVVSAKRDGDGCRIMVDGEQVTSERLLEIGRNSGRRRAIVIFPKETPYRCIGGTIFTLQRAGLAPVEAVMWEG